VAIVLVVEREPHPEHARLLLPVGHEPAALRLLDRKTAHDGELVRMQTRRLQGQIVAITFPRRWYQHGAAHLRQLHLEEEHVLRDRIRLLRFVVAARRPRTSGRVRPPDVHLRIDDLHARLPSREMAVEYLSVFRGHMPCITLQRMAVPS
jgi:hypothetical protein